MGITMPFTTKRYAMMREVAALMRQEISAEYVRF